MTKIFQFAIAAPIVLALAACDAAVGGLDTITAPAAYAPGTSSQRICSAPATTELSYERLVWIPAFATEPQGPYGATIQGSAWVAPYYNAGVTSAAPGTYYFRTLFVLPAGVKNVRVEGEVHADNQAIFYLNGVEVHRQADGNPYQNMQDPVDTFGGRPGSALDGLNVMRVDLVNGENTPSAAALDFCFTVTYMESVGGGASGAKGCEAAPAIAAAYLRGLGLQPDGGPGRNLVALVADHMSDNARFEGFDKCDAGYAPAVVAFVTAHLNG